MGGHLLIGRRFEAAEIWGGAIRVFKNFLEKTVQITHVCLGSNSDLGQRNVAGGFPFRHENVGQENTFSGWASIQAVFLCSQRPTNHQNPND